MTSLVAIFPTFLGYKLLNRQTPQQPLWQQVLLWGGGYSLSFSSLEGPYKALKMGGLTNSTDALRLMTSLAIPSSTLIIVIALALALSSRNRTSNS
ncbi:hypothetical protein V3W47_07370 [Deinococcus sp. YIM 134068]|uniref:hypothetical protein n=1 Tax=Deinococcus lichenicola TaxID=3118910 RepID=UPI002F93FEFE